MRIVVTALIAALLIAYPFIVYYALRFFEPSVIGALLVTIFVIRLWIIYRNSDKQAFFQQLCLYSGAIVLLLVAIFSNSVLSLRLTPVLINIGCFSLFAYTLIKPPSMIERFAKLAYTHMHGTAMPDYVVAYTRKVTMAWCMFFILNAAASLYTAYFSSMEIWMLYNGCIAYLLVALLFGVEYLVRLRVRQFHSADHSGPASDN